MLNRDLISALQFYSDDAVVEICIVPEIASGEVEYSHDELKERDKNWCEIAFVGEPDVEKDHCLIYAGQIVMG